MATKSQLKQYFETGKIPTQAQFGELIDFIQPLISDDVSDRPNQTLLFGGDTPNPIINGLRIVHYYENDDTIYNYWIFTNEAGRNNLSAISIPMFVIKRISSEEPNLSLDMPNLEYAIPTREQLTNWVTQGHDCDTADADTLHSALTNLTFKPWSEGGGSEFPRVAYIDSQSAWNTWLTKFKAAHPEAANSGGSGSPILNQWVIDSYTFIVETSEDINFAPDDTYEFINCSFINNDTTEDTIVMTVDNCVFRNCHIDSGYRIRSGEFYECVCNFDSTADNVIFKHCNIYGGGTLENCNVMQCGVWISSITGGTYRYCNLYEVEIAGSASITGGSIFGATFTSVTIQLTWINLFNCMAISGTAIKAGTTKIIQGFIYGCDFANITSTDWVMKGAQCCKFKSTLLSKGVIMADLFGNKSAATNGMNTGV